MKIHISIPKQILTLENESGVLASYPISTAAAGVGSEPGSMKTPSGHLRICEKIGYRSPVGMCFKNRLPAGTASEQKETADLIMSRILWLEGLDPENRNTKERYIYIHGTNHESLLGTPASHGCIRMSNSDVIDLYEKVQEGVDVEISEV